MPDERLVRELLASERPELAVERVVPIAEAEHWVYEVNGDLIVRIASDAAGAAKLQREAALLPEIGPRLPLAVPELQFSSRTPPYPFVAYRKIAGVSGELERPSREHWPKIAGQLAAFLSALHAFPVDRARALGVPVAPNEAFGAEYRTRDAAALLARVANFAPAIREAVPDILTEAMEPYLRGEVEPPPASPLAPVLSHADVKGEHILVSDPAGAVAGVIDWSDATVSDPLLDFTGLMIWLGEPFVRLVVERYEAPADGHFVERVCFYARCFALDNLGWQITTDWNAPLALLKTQARWAFAR